MNSGPNIYIIDRTKRLVVFADAIISDVVLDARNVGDDFLIFFLSRSLVQSVRTFNVRFHYRSSTVFWNFLLSTSELGGSVTFGTLYPWYVLSNTIPNDSATRSTVLCGTLTTDDRTTEYTL